MLGRVRPVLEREMREIARRSVHHARMALILWSAPVFGVSLDDMAAAYRPLRCALVKIDPSTPHVQVGRVSSLLYLGIFFNLLSCHLI